MNGKAKVAFNHAERIRSSHANGDQPTIVDRDDLAYYIVEAIAGEMAGHEIGTSYERFRFTPAEAIAHMDGTVAVETGGDRFKRQRFYGIPHPGVMFTGVVYGIKNPAVAKANELLKNLSAQDAAQYEELCWKIRAGQVMVDFLHFGKEVADGKRQPGDITIKFAHKGVAKALVHMALVRLAIAENFPLQAAEVPQYFPLDWNRTVGSMSRAGGKVRVTVLNGAVDVEYILPYNGAIFGDVVELKDEAEDVEGSGAPGNIVDEAILTIRACDEVIALLHSMEPPKIAEPIHVQSAPAGVAPLAADAVDPDQQAEYEKRAKEIDEELKTKANGSAPIADSAPEPAPEPTPEEELKAQKLAVEREIRAEAEVPPPAPGTASKKIPRKRKAAPATA